MRLSDSDRNALAQIARDIEDEDPRFADLMAWPQGARARPVATDHRTRHSGGHTAHAATGAKDDRAGVGSIWRSPTAWILSAMAAVGIAMMVLGAVGSRMDALAVGSCLLTIDSAWACVYRLTRKRSGEA